MGNMFGIGISGLNAARAALDITSHNISNVNTEGYNRQRLSQSAATPLFEGYGFIGRGVDLNSVSRLYDGFMERQLQNVTATNSGLDAQATALNDIDNLVSDGNAGISNVLQGFYSSLQTLGTQPSSIPARQSVVSQAQALAGRFQSMNSRLNELGNGLVNQISSSVETINGYAQQISDLNKQIASQGQGDDRQPSDLLDQRDNLVRNLNKVVKADLVVGSDGMYNVFIGQGQPLVLGETKYDVVMTRGAPAQPEDPAAPSISVKIPGTNSFTAIDSTLLGGGTIAGAMTTLNTDLARVQSDLGRMAIEFSDAVNRQHSLGVDLNGAPATGGVFTDLSAQRTAAQAATTPAGQAKALRDALSNFSLVLQDPAKLAISSGVQAAKATSGTLAISSIWQVSNLSPAANPILPAAPALTLDYTPGSTPPFGATFGGTPVTVTQSTTQSGVYQLTLASGQNLAFKFEGSSAVAQSLLVSPRTGVPPDQAAQLDNSNLLEMGRLQTRPLMAPTPNSTTTFMPAVGATPTANIQSFYGQAVSYVGSRAQVVQVGQKAQAAALQEISLKRESFSGVNLDEEAANLLRYQQAYQAASKVIQVAQDMFKSLLDLGR